MKKVCDAHLILEMGKQNLGHIRNNPFPITQPLNNHQALPSELFTYLHAPNLL